MFAQRLAPALRLTAQRSFHSARSAAVKQTATVAAVSVPIPRSFPAGNVNDPVKFPVGNKAHGSYHWTFERGLSAALVPLVGATAVTSVHPVLDGVLAVALVVHTHIGFDQVLTDYLHPRKFPVIGNIAKWFVRLASGGVLVGIYQFNTTDIGLTELCKKMWHA